MVENTGFKDNSLLLGKVKDVISHLVVLFVGLIYSVAFKSLSREVLLKFMSLDFLTPLYPVQKIQAPSTFFPKPV